jgi:hypothetical protein
MACLHYLNELDTDRCVLKNCLDQVFLATLFVP